MTAIAKLAKTHPAAKKCCGWEEPAICHDRLYIFWAGGLTNAQTCFQHRQTDRQVCMEDNLKNEALHIPHWVKNIIFMKSTTEQNNLRAGSMAGFISDLSKTGR